MEGLPGRLPVGQVTMKSYLPGLENYLSRTTGWDFCQALLRLASTTPRLPCLRLALNKSNGFPLVILFCFGRFNCFSGFVSAISVVLLVSVVSFRFGGFVLGFGTCSAKRLLTKFPTRNLP